MVKQLLQRKRKAKYTFCLAHTMSVYTRENENNLKGRRRSYTFRIFATTCNFWTWRHATLLVTVTMVILPIPKGKRQDTRQEIRIMWRQLNWWRNGVSSLDESYKVLIFHYLHIHKILSSIKPKITFCKKKKKYINLPIKISNIIFSNFHIDM